MSVKNLKVLGLSLLALVGVMAITASAAQAKYQLLEGGVAVKDLKLEALTLLFEYLLPALGLWVHCKGSTASILVTESGGGVIFTITAGTIYKGCEVVSDKECEVEIEGHQASGTLSMDSEELYLFKMTATEGNPFVTVYMSGIFCNLPEEEVIAGSITRDILEALKNLATHLVHLSESKLGYGHLPAQLHGVNLETPVLSHYKSTTGASYAIHLTGL